MCYLSQNPSTFCIVYGVMPPPCIYSIHPSKNLRINFYYYFSFTPPFNRTAISNVSISIMAFKSKQPISFFPAPTCDNLYLIPGLLQYISVQFFFYSFLFYSQFLFKVVFLKITYIWKFYYLLKNNDGSSLFTVCCA